MRTRIFAVALAACIPAAVFAQGKGARSSDTASSSSSRASSASSGARSPTSHDLADLNPAALLINKRKKIPLADSTVAQLKAVEKRINERNAQFFSTYDSVRKWTMPIGDNATTLGFGLRGGVADSKLMAPAVSPAEQAKMQSSMRDLRALMGDLRERRKPDVTDALGVVPDAQKKAAADLLAQQDGDLEKLIGGRP